MSEFIVLVGVVATGTICAVMSYVIGYSDGARNERSTQERRTKAAS